MPGRFRRFSGDVLRWYRVVTAPGPGIATRDPADRQPAALDTAVHGDRLECVRRARRVVAAHLAVERADREAVGLQQADQDVLHEPATRARQRSSSSPRSRYDAPAAPGCARTTSTLPSASVPTRSRIKCRSRRLTRLRVTAGPTDFDTTKPTRPGPVSSRLLVALSTFGVTTCTTTSGPPARRPRRTACRKSAAALRRWLAESTRWPGLRQRGSCDPCGDARTGSRDRRGCASAGGSRAPCAGDGCSAGTYACSRAHLHDSCWDASTHRLARRKTSPVMQHNWHRSPARQTPLDNVRQSPGRVRSWTCGTGRTGFDLPTVRGSREHGQFSPQARRASAPASARTDDPDKPPSGISQRHAEGSSETCGEPVAPQVRGC